MVMDWHQLAQGQFDNESCGNASVPELMTTGGGRLQLLARINYLAK